MRKKVEDVTTAEFNMVATTTRDAMWKDAPGAEVRSSAVAESMAVAGSGYITRGKGAHLNWKEESVIFKFMMAVGGLLVLATFCVMIWFVFYMPKLGIQWEIESVKYTGPGQHLSLIHI